MIETVIVTDDRNRILARTADEVQRYHFFNTVCGKTDGGAFCPGVLTGEYTVTGNDPELVAVSRIQCNAAGPVDRLVPDPAVTAVLQVVCNQRTAQLARLPGVISVQVSPPSSDLKKRSPHAMASRSQASSVQDWEYHCAQVVATSLLAAGLSLVTAP